MPCEDAPCCGCCDLQNDYISQELAEELGAIDLDLIELHEDVDDVDEDADADAETLASAGFGTEEDYGGYGPEK